MARPKTDKKTAKTNKAKKGDASPAKPTKARKGRAPETPPFEAPEAPATAPETAPTGTPSDAETLDGHEVCEALKHVTNACPKADGPDGNPALAFVLVDGTKLIATDDRGHHTAFLSHPVSVGPLKVTRASIRGLLKKLDGELKGGKEESTRITVVWTGLLVEIRGVSETHHYPLKTFDAGPDAKALHLAASPVGDGVRVPLKLWRKVQWKGDGSVLVYTDPATGRVCLDAMAGPATIYRATLAAASLGVRQPSLPGVAASPKPPPAAPTEPAPGPSEPPSSPAAPSPVVPPLQGLPGGLAWLCVVVPKLAFAKLLRESLDALSLAFAKLLRESLDALSPCPPWRVDEDAQQVVLGPVPRGAFLDALTARFDALAVPYTTQPADAPRVYTLASGAASEPVRAALPDVVDAEVVEAEAPPFEDPAPGVEGDVLRVTVATWEALDADATARLVAPLEMARVIWTRGGAYHVTEPVTPRVALALEKVLRELGCVELEGSRRANGGEVRTFMDAGA